jgi:4-hydroxy-3-polyprenylbenzoate decarboxylase
MQKHRLIVAVTGASGSIYARNLFRKLLGLTGQIDRCGMIFSDYAHQVWNHELDGESYQDYPWSVYENNNMFTPPASGSAGYRTMIIIPCSMGTMGRIAAGVANDLITRSADVMLKERGRLIIVPRELPYNLIHINNMKLLTEAGAIICPASPSFYSKPQSIDAVVDTVVNRVLDLAGFSLEHYKWREED